MRARLKIVGLNKRSTYGVIDDRDDGLTIRLDLFDPVAGNWTVTSITVTGPEPDGPVTSEALVRVSRELPTLMAVLATLWQAETTSAVAVSGETGDELAQVAAIYTRAVESSQAPVVTVMREMHMSRPTASRRIRAAKDLGLLTEQVGESK